MDLLDENEMSTEQKFLFMLDERLRAIEEDMVNVKHSLYGKPKVIPDHVKELIDHYTKLWDVSAKDNIEKTNNDLLIRLPSDIHELVNSDTADFFESILYHSTQTLDKQILYKRFSYLLVILGDKVTPNLIAWIEKVDKSM